MINSINMSNYFKVVYMSQSLNNYIRQATITKSQINASLTSALYTGIGSRVDITV